MQEQAVALLDDLFKRLSSPLRPSKPSARKSWPWQKVKKNRVEPGLYIWGGVGRGKTYLVDCFFEALPIKEKRRRHFHRFMQDVHAELHELGQVRDPLPIIAERIAATTRVICFDEFFVSDITDAMLLGGLFTELFDRGVTLVATSNIPPNQLYSGGLQRERFLPAIEQIERHTAIFELDSDSDYRLRVLQQAEIFHTPLDASATENLQRYFADICPDRGENNADLIINHRKLRTRKLGDGIAWFDFETLCDSPRSHDDYIELAKVFHTVLLSDIPEMSWEDENAARRFIGAVDEFYDRRVKLIISSAKPLLEMYNGKRLEFEIQRTYSRLQEMQSNEYLAEAHRP